MKKILLSGLTLAVVAGCGSSSDTTADTTGTTTDTTTTAAATKLEPPAAPTEIPSGISARSEAATSVATGEETTNITVPLTPGWNPVGLECSQVTAVDPGAGVAGMATYNGTGYDVSNLDLASLNSDSGGRRGLFVYATQATTFTYQGQDDGAGNYVDLRSGWNLVSFTSRTGFPARGLTPREPNPSASPGGSPGPGFNRPFPDGSPPPFGSPFPAGSPGVVLPFPGPGGSPGASPPAGGLPPGFIRPGGPRPGGSPGAFPEGSPGVTPPGAVATGSPHALPSGSPMTLGSVILTTLFELGSGGASTPVTAEGGTVNPGRAYWVYSQREVRLECPSASPAASPI